MRRIAVVVTALALALPPLALAGEDGGRQAAPADAAATAPAAESKAEEHAAPTCGASGACCGDPMCGAPADQRAAAGGTKKTCPCGKRVE